MATDETYEEWLARKLKERFAGRAVTREELEAAIMELLPRERSHVDATTDGARVDVEITSTLEWPHKKPEA